ncbi:MAG: rhomboid family intramembrane serine protease [Bacteroidetes bacterium]|nr:MAG: rhomboid family intramembrane serine protease [Bacteroidota bacterium]
MDEITPIVGVIMAISAFITYKGLGNRSFFRDNAFNVDAILVGKDYKRLIMSGFLHADWGHFGFNMITLFFFGPMLEETIGIPWFLVVYLGSLIGGNLFALYIHRNHPNYTAIGASGAVSGIVFASIAMFPGMTLGLIFFPYLPSWVFGLLYVLYSIYGMRKKSDNIGHEAHLGGGIAGLLLVLVYAPQMLFINYIPILFILIPSVIFLILIVVKPEILLIDKPFRRKKNQSINLTRDQRYNTDKAQKQREINALLDKIGERGMESLTQVEKDRLKELTK